MKRSTQRRTRSGRRFFHAWGIAALVVAGALGGCADVEIHTPDWNWDPDSWEVPNTNHKAEAQFRHDIASEATISVLGVAGSVEIVGDSEATDIVVRGTRRVRSHSEADARDHLENLQVETWQSGGTVYVETRQPALNRGRSYQVEYRIVVPSGTDVRVTHVAGLIEIRSVDGDVAVEATAGGVKLQDLTSDVRATVVTGSVNASVSVPSDGHVDLRSSTGDIHLSVPLQTSASLHAATTAGTVRTIDLTLLDEDPRARVLQATMADGSGDIRLETVVGDITVQGR